MSLKALKLMAQRNKYLIFGYFRENDKRDNHVYPMAMIFLCLEFTFATCDKFLENNEMDPSVEVRANEIIGRGTEDSQFVIVEGMNEVEKDVHIWKIRFNKTGKSNAIGVISHHRVAPIQYLFNIGSGLCSGYESVVLKSMDIECECGAEAKLTLDCRNWTLMMEIDEQKYQLKVQHGKYRLRLRIWTYNQSNFQLLQYSHNV